MKRRRRALMCAGRLALAGLAAALAFSAGAAGPHDAPVQGTASPGLLGGLLTESRVLYPLQVGSWMAVAEHRYPEQYLGVSVRYIDNRKQRWIDLYFYPAGLQTPEALALVAASERDGIAEAARQGGRATDLGALEPVALERGAAAGGPVPGWRLGLSYPDERLASAMLLFTQEMYLVKARASAAQPPASVASLQRELQVFMESVAAQLRIASTGACWLPARTGIAAALPGEDQVLASYRDPGREVSAVVVGDRVLVAEAEAERAPQLAVQLTQALYPGCVAPELIEPEVPRPLREIRIEYRRAAGDAPDVRTPRAGSLRAPSRGTG
ncbi:hypothetical protein [Pseudoxanthomonas suwonensis]|uniref:Secreted protein n=1 Tax=Pseudoxanthomonas suwonensis TaxID=314722 RepID=A0A0E3Z1Y1_9GAMM|nr:hypothetical protein [Pseudoxanthomonas suwonensis]AKC87398.1 hypothetical protein WQ53_12185 [Pseudoxanthomonas suwonensis]